MLYNTFIGLKLKKLITQLTIFIAIISFFLIIQKKNDESTKKIENIEVIYEKNDFNNELLKKRVKQTASSIKIRIKSGDTLEKILKKSGFENQEIFEVIKETKKIFGIFDNPYANADPKCKKFDFGCKRKNKIRI